MDEALTWLIAIELLGVLAFPITFGLFSRLPDRGALLSKPLALLLCSYIFWLVGHTQLIPNTRPTVLVIVLLLTALFLYLVQRHGSEMMSFVRSHWRVLLAGEIVFLLAYFAWVTMISQSPAIVHCAQSCTERPMDFGFLNAILRADHFPPEDPWLAGHSISYYYFGHMMVAFLTKLTGITSAISFNLGGPLTAAMVVAGTFSLVYNLVHLAGGRTKTALLFALAGPLLVVFISSLEGVMEFIYAQGWGSEGFWGWVAIPGLGGAGAADPSFFPQDQIWWWRAARTVENAITEFPFFIFLLGDLHAHALSLPFLTLNLALALNLFICPQRLELLWPRHRWWEPVVVALCLGSLAFINLWDFPVFAGILVAVLGVKALRDREGDLVQATVSALRIALPIMALAVVMYLPFYLSIAGRAPLILPLKDVNTPPLAFGLIWGLFLTVSVGFLLRQGWRLPMTNGGHRSILAIAVAVPLAPLVIWIFIRLLISPFNGGVGAGFEDVGIKLLRLLPLLLIVGAALYSGLIRTLRDDGKALAFVLVLMALGFYLLMGVELFYLDDLFGPRWNTVFKLYFQAWLLLGLVSAFGLYYWWASLRQRGRLPLRVGGYAWVGLVAVLIVASLYYPLGASLDRVKFSDDPATLNGLAYLENQRPAEYRAITWLRQKAPWGRVVEAVGNDYTEFGRVSSLTGLPTILGWPTHEEHWRGSPKPLANRQADVDSIYRSEDEAQVRALLEEYRIRYLFVGPREQTTYPEADLERFRQFMTPVFDEGQGVVIYDRLSEAR